VITSAQRRRSSWLQYLRWGLPWVADERPRLGYDPPSYLKDSWILVR
jgi:hypothetical protein